MRLHRWPPISGHGCSITEKYRACSASSLRRRWLTKGRCGPRIGAKRGKGGRKGRRKRGEKNRSWETEERKGLVQQRLVDSSFLSFFLFFFLAIFHHFLPARPSPRETLFTWTVRVVGGINWHSSRPDTRLYFRSSLVMKKAPLFVTARTPRTEEGGYERRFFEGTSLTRFSRIWNRGWR